MASQTSVHTVLRAEYWVNVREGNPDALDTYETKIAAQAAGRFRARSEGVEHVIHMKDGTIGETNSYNIDPRNISG